MCICLCKCVLCVYADSSSVLFGNNWIIAHSMIARGGFGFPGAKVPGTIWVTKL